MTSGERFLPLAQGGEQEGVSLETRKAVAAARMEWLLQAEKDLVDRMNAEDLRLFQLRGEIADLMAEQAALERQ